MKGRFTLEDVSRLGPKAQQEVAAQLYKKGIFEFTTDMNDPEGILKPMWNPIRQRRGGASKLQRDFLSEMQSVNQSRNVWILDDAITLKLANGVTYRPDVWKIVWGDPAVPMILAYEVKGPHFWAAAKVKLKVAASAYPWIEFHLVTRPVRGRDWKIERVLS